MGQGITGEKGGGGGRGRGEGEGGGEGKGGTRRSGERVAHCLSSLIALAEDPGWGFPFSGLLQHIHISHIYLYRHNWWVKQLYFFP